VKRGDILIIVVLLLFAGVITAHFMYISKFKIKFKALEKEIIITSNKLTTAKIVQENLNHVRDLVFKNMDIPGQADSVTHESYFFSFITTCVNDLKLKLLSVEPRRPVTVDRVTTYTYDIEVEGDFFSFGELCSKLENSRRIVSMEDFGVSLIDSNEKENGGPQNKKIRIKIRINTYRVKKFEQTPVMAVNTGNM